MINIKFITVADKAFSVVRDIRTSVFVNEQGAAPQEEFDFFDKAEGSSIYALMYEGDTPVATARLILNEKGYKIGRIAVLKEYRKKGYGRIIVRLILDKAFELGADKVYLDAQNYAVPFYEKFGFTVTGDEIIEIGLPHMPMLLERKNYVWK